MGEWCTHSTYPPTTAELAECPGPPAVPGVGVTPMPGGKAVGVSDPQGLIAQSLTRSASGASEAARQLLLHHVDSGVWVPGDEGRAGVERDGEGDASLSRDPSYPHG